MFTLGLILYYISTKEHFFKTKFAIIQYKENLDDFDTQLEFDDGIENLLFGLLEVDPAKRKNID